MTLWEAIESLDGERWEWGKFDCLHFCAAVLRKTTGRDYREGLPTYADWDGAEQIMKDHGGIRGILTKQLGPPKPVLQACRGDVVLADLGMGDAAGICTGQKAAFASHRGGVIFIDMSHCTEAWNGS